MPLQPSFPPLSEKFPLSPPRLLSSTWREVITVNIKHPRLIVRLLRSTSSQRLLSLKSCRHLELLKASQSQTHDEDVWDRRLLSLLN